MTKRPKGAGARKRRRTPRMREGPTPGHVDEDEELVRRAICDVLWDTVMVFSYSVGTTQ